MRVEIYPLFLKGIEMFKALKTGAFASLDCSIGVYNLIAGEPVCGIDEPTLKLMLQHGWLEKVSQKEPVPENKAAKPADETKAAKPKQK